MSFMEWKEEKLGKDDVLVLYFGGLVDITIFTHEGFSKEEPDTYTIMVNTYNPKTEWAGKGFTDIEKAKVCAEKYLIKKIVKAYKLLMAHKELMDLNKIIENYEVNK